MSVTTQNRADSDSLVVSYLFLRRAIGLVGISLPFVLALGKLLLEGPGIEASVSSYYHTVMRDVFVGSLCAIAVFLLSYTGYERRDNIAANFGFVFAIGTALFPVAPEIGADATDRLVSMVHIVFAALYFLTLAYFSLVLFPRTHPDRAPTPRKLQRNRVYKTTGYVMLLCLALIALVPLLPADSALLSVDPVFWLEAAAIVAFGIAWMTKGEAILQDL